MSRSPAHAGRLHPEEQFVFAMLFALMAGFVVIVTMSAVRSTMSPLLAGTSAAAAAPTLPAGSSGVTHPTGLAPPIQPPSARLNASLAAALATVLNGHPGHLAVGVIDETTGQQALYAATQRFSSGSIVRADILAALLVRRPASAPVAGEQAVLATTMMDAASAPATTSLWRYIGEGNGLAAANRLLKLTQTVPGAGGRWDQTRTTVADQLQLLVDLTSTRSPLTAGGRDYALDLMRGHRTQAPWGVSAAGTATAVQGGSLPDGRLWAAGSIGIVVHGGRVLLVAVLSSGSPSQAAGISLASAAAAAAADVMTHAGH